MHDRYKVVELVGHASELGNPYQTCTGAPHNIVAIGRLLCHNSVSNGASATAVVRDNHRLTEKLFGLACHESF